MQYSVSAGLLDFISNSNSKLTFKSMRHKKRINRLPEIKYGFAKIMIYALKCLLSKTETFSYYFPFEYNACGWLCSFFLIKYVENIGLYIQFITRHWTFTYKILFTNTERDVKLLFIPVYSVGVPLQAIWDRIWCFFVL